MKKKIYLEPTVEMLEIKCGVMLAGSPGASGEEGETGSSGTGSGSAGDGDPDLGRKHGSSWSNIWGDKW